MEKSWRSRPIQGNICPTCFISHLPFCPQHPALIRIGFAPDNLQQRFPFDPNPTLHGPFADPFRHMPGPSSHLDLRPNSNPFHGHPLGPLRSWNGNQLLEREPFRSLDFGFQGMHFERGRGDFFREPYDERIHKRARLEDVGLSSFTQIAPLPHTLYNDCASNVGRISSEDQRRLELIRHHGGQSKSLPQVGIGMGSTFESGRDFGSMDLGNQGNVDGVQRFECDYRMDGYSHGSSVQERRVNDFNAGERAGLEDQSGHGSDWGSNSVPNSSNPYGFSSAARQEASLTLDQMEFNQRNSSMQVNAHGAYPNFPQAPYSQNTDKALAHENSEFPSEDYKITGEQQQIQRNDRDRFLSEVYAFQKSEETTKGTVDRHHDCNYRSYHAQHYKPGDIATGSPNYAELIHQNSQDSVVNCREDYCTRDSHENFRAYDHTLLPSKEFSSGIPRKRPQHSHTASWQASSMQEQDSRISNLPAENHQSNIIPPHPVYPMQNRIENRQDFYGQHNDVIPDCKALPLENIHMFVEPEKSDEQNMNRRGYSLMLAGSSINSSMPIQLPLKDQSSATASHLKPASLPSATCSTLYPVPVSSSTTVHSSFPTLAQGPSDVQPSSHAYLNKPLVRALSGFASEPEAHSKQYEEVSKSFISKPSAPEKPKVIDAAHLFRSPHRMNRPGHIVIILRGLPGSGKSYLAKVLRDLEVENGGNAPRIHSMDDYFMFEVEKVEEIEGPKSSSLAKGKKRITKKVMEYCYEPEMEEAYRSSMLKAFKKTLDEGIFTFIIVDDRNLRVADFAQFWAIAKRSGYEVYLLEATYKDPVGCAARNVHGFTSDDIQKMVDQWEHAPPLYLQLDVQSLFHGDDLNEHGIQEVDMDMEDAAGDEDGIFGGQLEQPLANDAPNDSLRAGERWVAERDDLTEDVKELGKSKWSEDVEEHIEKSERAKRNSNALSGLIQAYSKGGRSVHWGDQVGNSGFSIGAAKKTHISSLFIGPGAGYNLGSNPLPEDNADVTSKRNSTEPKERIAFLEHLRAEHESFRAVFDRRRQRIGGLEVDED